MSLDEIKRVGRGQAGESGGISADSDLHEIFLNHGSTRIDTDKNARPHKKVHWPAANAGEGSHPRQGGSVPEPYAKRSGVAASPGRKPVFRKWSGGDLAAE